MMEKAAGRRVPKRKIDDVEMSSSPYIPMFEQFRTELDEHHDRREKIVKNSRDITASSKKCIFALQRIPSIGEKLPESFRQGKDFSQHTTTIRERFESIAPDLQTINYYRYQRQISPGIQEFMEAILFEHYIETQTILSLEEARSKIPAINANSCRVHLSEADYVLALFDLSGELMRYAITQLATGRQQSLSTGVSSGKGGDGERVGKRDQGILDILQSLRTSLESLSIRGNPALLGEFEGKLRTLQASVEKVESAMYSMTVREGERPQGWNPALDVPKEVAEVNG